MEHSYEIKKEKDLDNPRRTWYHIYVDGNFKLTVWNKKQVKCYIKICEDK